MLYRHQNQKKQIKRNRGVYTISWILELINNIPYILSYMIPGYIFLSLYYWISFIPTNEFEHLIIKSVAASYVLDLLLDFITNIFRLKYTTSQKMLLLIIFSSILGIISGKIIHCNMFNEFLRKSHIDRTTNENIWQDTIKDNTWVRVFMKDGTSYLGYYRYGESNQREPIIVLGMYQKLNSKANVIIDNSQNPKELIMLNTRDFEKIEITYD